MIRMILAFTIAATLTACAGTSGSGGSTALPASRAVGSVRGPAGSLGPILSTSDGGEIFGFDVDETGNDGVLASLGSNDISVQTFDETTGKITKTFAKKIGKPRQRGDDYVADGIFAGDAGLIDFERAGKTVGEPAKDLYHVMNPVTAEKFTGIWNPTLKLFHVLQWAVNQSTSTSVFYGYQRIGSDTPKLIVSNVATNQVSNVITLDPNRYSGANGPQLSQDTVNNLAVVATSPSFGRAGGPPPIIATINLKNGKIKSFNGVDCPGSVRCGYANGIGYDSATGIACTTTELDGGVEFYNVPKQTGFHELLPGGGQFFAGTYVTSDPVNQLFLIAQPFSGSSSSGSSVQVYDENGNFVESINGLDFTDAGGLVIPIRIAINPSKRIGWVNGPNVNQLQQFSY